MRASHLTFALLSAALLTGCGGSSGSSAAPAPTVSAEPTPSTPADVAALACRNAYSQEETDGLKSGKVPNLTTAPPSACAGLDDNTKFKLRMAVEVEAFDQAAGKSASAGPTPTASSASKFTPAQQAACKAELRTEADHDLALMEGGARSDDPRLDYSKPAACKGIDDATGARLTNEAADEALKAHPPAAAPANQ